jgi:hypothetical protein
VFGALRRPVVLTDWIDDEATSYLTRPAIVSLALATSRIIAPFAMAAIDKIKRPWLLRFQDAPWIERAQMLDDVLSHLVLVGVNGSPQFFSQFKRSINNFLKTFRLGTTPAWNATIVRETSLSLLVDIRFFPDLSEREKEK